MAVVPKEPYGLPNEPPQPSEVGAGDLTELIQQPRSGRRGGDGGRMRFALLLGSALGMLNIWLLLFWPLSLLGILIQAGTEERLLGSKFGQAYRRYAGRTGQLVPRLWGGAS